MDDLLVYVFLNSISVKSGQWADDNERLCAMEARNTQAVRVSRKYVCFAHK